MFNGDAVDDDSSTKASSGLGLKASVVSLQAFRPVAPPVPVAVNFDRHELGKILNIYGKMVAKGEWRDYAIDHLSDRAVFSIFRRASEIPLFRVEKNPKLAQKQGAYSVIAAGGMILKRGHDLERVLHVFDKNLREVQR